VANNRFTGPIPRSIFNTSGRLSEALFLNNHLSGCLPYEVGLVEGLTLFDAGGNEITGPSPLSFGCLGSAEEINLAGNRLYGHVPDVLCLLANLSLSGNYFHSVGRHCMELVRSRVLDVRRNCVLGFPDQRPLLECTWFYADPAQHCPFLRAAHPVPVRPARRVRPACQPRLRPRELKEFVQRFACPGSQSCRVTGISPTGVVGVGVK
jgi:hypothetical protein